MPLILPPFNDEGLLPPDDYPLTIEQLRQSHLVTGEGNPSPNWDAEWRSQLVDNLEMMVMQLWDVGVTQIFANGSFAEDRDHPGDIDAYFECAQNHFQSLAARLNQIEPERIWTWDPASRRPARGKMQLPMWFKYHVEIYPHYGQIAGVDRHGRPLQFPAYFRKTRDTDSPKGIVQIIRQ